MRTTGRSVATAVVAAFAAMAAVAMPIETLSDPSLRLQVNDVGFGVFGAKMLESVARQPDFADGIRRAGERVLEAFYDIPTDGLDIGQVGGALLESLARNPEVHAQTMPAFDLFIDAVKVIDYKSPDRAYETEREQMARYGISEETLKVFGRDADEEKELVYAGVCRTGKSLMDAAARNPDVGTNLRVAFSNVVSCMIGRPDAEINGLDMAGKSLMDAIARQPEAYSNLVESFAAASVVCSNLTEVQAVMVGSSAGSMMDAIARQPEAYPKLKTAFGDFSPAIVGRSAAESLAFKEICGSLMGSIARQPEVYSNLYEEAEHFIELSAGEQRTECEAMSLGRIGGALLDATARQPEAWSNMYHAARDVSTMLIGRNNGEAFALGLIGGALMDAIARQPEVCSNICAEVVELAELMNGRPTAEAVAIGTVGNSLMDAMARQPEVASNMCEAVREIATMMAGRPGAEVSALGDIGASLMDAMARQPEVASNLCVAVRELSTTMAGRSSEESFVLGKIGAAQMDALARQPEAYSNICAAVRLLGDLMAGRPDGEVYGIGGMGVTMMDASARQPEAHSNLCEAAKAVATAVTGRSAGVAHGIGWTGKGWMDAIARQPESVDDLMLTFDVVVASMINRDEDASRTLGHTGYSLMNSISRQPEMVGLLNDAFVGFAKGLADGPKEAALGLDQTGNSYPDSLARQPEASDLIDDAMEWIFYEMACFRPETKWLRDHFGPPTHIQPVYTDGVYSLSRMILGTNYESGVTLAKDLGAITLDLNGWSICGTNGVDVSGGTGGNGGPAIVIDGDCGAPAGMTLLSVTNDTVATERRPMPGFEDPAGIFGGNGGMGAIPGDGSMAIVDAEGDRFEVVDPQNLVRDGVKGPPDYLSFTAKGGVGSIRLVAYQYEAEEDPVDPGLEYAYDPFGPWVDFRVGCEADDETVVMPHGVDISDGETIYVRRKSEIPILTLNNFEYVDVTNAYLTGSYWRFDILGSGSGVEAHGNVMSLLDRSCQSREVGEEAFLGLFESCDLLTAPELPATNLATACYMSMFADCPLLSETPILPAEKVPDLGYMDMFAACGRIRTVAQMNMRECGVLGCDAMFVECESLTDVPLSLDVKLEWGCFCGMFLRCSSLKVVPELPSKDMFPSCYEGMFCGTAITNAPVLPALKMADYCYYNMFGSCTNLVEPPKLSATTLATNCYANMFGWCSALTNAPALPATDLAFECYHEMFQECPSLLTAPELPATNLELMCYSGMLLDCTNINRVVVGFKKWREGGEIFMRRVEYGEETSYSATEAWLYNVAPTGTFVCPLELPVIADDSHIPEGWMTKKRFTLPTALPGMTYAVSNETSGAEAVEPTGGEPGGADYEVTVGDRIKIYCIPSPGYAVQGHNPLDLGDLNEGIVLDEGDHVLPKAILPPSAVWARCDTAGLPGFDPDDLPEGTYLADGEILFAKCNESGAATFDFSALDATVFTGATIRFADGEIAVDTLKFDPDYALRFVGGNGTVLKGTADKSVFDGLVAPLPFFAARLSEPGPQLTVWSNLTFTCDAEVRPVWRNGGAIAIDAGGFVLDGCTFADCFAEEFGGAVYAPLLAFDSMITNCVFDGSWVSAWNGYGGAIYVSAIHDGCVISVVDSRFTGNDAVNGGAICTVRAADDQERPIALELAGCRFEDNTADYGGGAIFAEGAVAVTAAADGARGSSFSRNVAGHTGGAICVSGIDGVSVPVAVTVGEGAVFAGNVASNDYTWTAGGAIAVLTAGCTLDVSEASFATNAALATASGGNAFGGAVYAADKGTNRFCKTLFAGNAVRAGANACYGGAISFSTGCQTLDTCVFDCRAENPSAATYGGAADFDVSDDVQVRNCSFRFAAVEAISAYAVENLAITNCVIVGNGLIAPSTYPDVFCEMCGKVSVAYTAYGSIWFDAELAVDDFNLSGRLTDIYADDSLRLRATGFNPVAALGLEQPGVSDIDDVPYGSLPCGTSMGAYETPAEPLRITLDGSKNYDGNATSNGCEWTWKLSCTNGEETAWTDLVDPADDLRNELRKVFSITNWFFGDFNVGHYASTNATESTRIVAGVAGVDERVEWMRRVLEFVYTGTIRAALSEDLVLIFSPDEYAWTGEEISPTNEPDGEVTVIVSNTLTGAILVRGVDYDLDWRNNVNPTDAAKIVVTGMNNYAETLIISNFFISAYCTKYFQDVDTAHPAAFCTVTNGALSGDMAVAAIAVPPGYCLDWQWPLESDHHTNGTVYAFGRGGVGKEDILTLWVDYEKDVNVPGGDDIPDKYQARVVFAIVNGWWNGERNGADKIGWVTLTNETGRWATDGRGMLSNVPGVGDKPFSGYETGEQNGAWNQDLATVIDRRSFPIFLFGYGQIDSPLDPDRGRKPFLMAASGDKALSASPWQNVLAITDFSVKGPDAVFGTAEAIVQDRLTGKRLASAKVAGQDLTICGAEWPNSTWQPISNAHTDSDGGWSVDRVRSFKFFRIILE